MNNFPSREGAHPYLVRVLLILLVVLLSSSVAVAQQTQGSIFGTVTDDTGSIIPGERVWRSFPKSFPKPVSGSAFRPGPAINITNTSTMT